MQDLALYGIAVTPLIIAVVQVGKEAGLSSRLAPVLSLILGVLAGVGSQATLTHPVWIQGAVLGVAVGLAASGTYAGISTFSSSKPTKPADATPVPPPAPAEAPPAA